MEKVVKSRRGDDSVMLQEYFAEITDPRQQVKVKHKLLEIVVMTICEVWEDIFDYCCVKEGWFRRGSTRFDKLDKSFLAFGYMAAIMIWLH